MLKFPTCNPFFSNLFVDFHKLRAIFTHDCPVINLILTSKLFCWWKSHDTLAANCVEHFFLLLDEFSFLSYFLLFCKENFLLFHGCLYEISQNEIFLRQRASKQTNERTTDYSHPTRYSLLKLYFNHWPSKTNRKLLVRGTGRAQEEFFADSNDFFCKQKWSRNIKFLSIFSDDLKIDEMILNRGSRRTTVHSCEHISFDKLITNYCWWSLTMTTDQALKLFPKCFISKSFFFTIFTHRFINVVMTIWMINLQINHKTQITHFKNWRLVMKRH